MMKKLPIYFSFLACSVFSYADDEIADEEVPVLEDNTQEIAFLEQNPLLQTPSSIEDLDLSAPELMPKYKSPLLAVGLSGLIPGLGHAYLGEFEKAGALAGSSILMSGLESSQVFHDETLRDSNLLMIQNTWMYGIYAAYRDARAYNRQEGYRYKMPTESLLDITWAPFQWSVLKKPEVWGGFLGILALSAGIDYLFSSDASIHTKLSSSREVFPLMAFPVGIGEEAFFRGYLQPVLSEIFTPWGGIALSSLVFGAVHIPNASGMSSEEKRDYYCRALPCITISGLYFGWMTHRSGSLKESVALHAWWDFAVFLASYSASQSLVVGSPSFAISFPF